MIQLRQSLIISAVRCTLSPVFAYDVPQNPRAKLSFNSNWRLFVGDAIGAEAPNFDDSKWNGVTTPHGWNEDSAFKVSIEQLPTGIVWYRKHFSLPAGSAGKKVFLEFEDIHHGGEFFLNGQSIGKSENGVMAFGFDITDKVKASGNVLSARIDNA